MQKHCLDITMLKDDLWQFLDCKNCHYSATKNLSTFERFVNACEPKTVKPANYQKFRPVSDENKCDFRKDGFEPSNTTLYLQVSNN